MLHGYNKHNKDETGFLSISEPKSCGDIYKIVGSVNDAMKFPSVNVYNKQGFGTPKQWIEFFKGEEALSSWKFHLVKVNGPNAN